MAKRSVASVRNRHAPRVPLAVATLFWFIALAFVAASHGYPSDGKGPVRQRWVRVDYDDLVDRSALTHSGKTVGTLLRTPPRKGGGLPNPVLADLQPYLEPFSFVLNEIVSGTAPSGGNPYGNVVDEYPPGARQPAWAALFREGYYQLFVGPGRARLFLPGENPRALLRRYHGVVRHPLARAMEKSGSDRLAVEVYAFRNDYATRTLSLDPNPYVTEITRADLAPKTREVSLPGLATFFAQAPALEAAEIDDGDDFFLYGNGASGQTVAGQPVSLPDFAVVYRAVFHHGRNPPYVSLDAGEDGRYAKVNFGGLLADTRVGTVLMEADKLFKTMITGIATETRAPAADNVRAAIPDFRTMDERALFRDTLEDTRVRFWFYPDRIRTVTDGRIGVVESYKFTADEERIGGKVRSDRAGRETIDHLNRNFDRYAQVFPPYRELLTVGRMMAVAKWLLGTNAGRRADLDALLSVELPAHRTPRRNRKLLAATDGVRLSRGDTVKEYHRVYCFDEFLDQGAPGADDQSFVDKARNHVKGTGIETLVPPGGMFRHIAEIQRYTVTSISGGVDLDPKNFAPPRRSSDSPLLAKIRDARPASAGSPATPGGGMIRSTVRGSTAPPRRSGKIPPSGPKDPGAGKRAPAIEAPPGGASRGGATPAPVEIRPRPDGKPTLVKNRSYPAEIIVTTDPARGGTIVLRKGEPLEGGTGADPEK